MKAENLLKLYKQGHREFPGVDLRGLYFDGEDLSGINLAGANLCSPKYFMETRGINIVDANFTNTIFFVPRPSSPGDLDVSAIQGAICVSTKSDVDKLNLDEYHRFAVEIMLEEVTPI
jgi:uncharacterized protein YjbI with pentapeptide repeats